MTEPHWSEKYTPAERDAIIVEVMVGSYVRKATWEAEERLPEEGFAMASRIDWRLDAAVHWCDYERVYIPATADGELAVQALTAARRALLLTHVRVRYRVPEAQSDVASPEERTAGDRRSELLAICGEAMHSQAPDPAMASVYQVVGEWVEEFVAAEKKAFQTRAALILGHTPVR